MSDIFKWDFMSTMFAWCPIALQTGVGFQGHDPLHKVSCPGAPKLQTISMDSPSVVLSSSSQPLQEVYPIHLDNIASFQGLELESIMLTSPIHIHTPTAHLGLIQQGVNGQEDIRAKDVVLYIQTFSRKLLDYRIYARISGEMKIRVKASFMHRSGNTPTTTKAWENFLEGKHTNTGPIGEDLLLGCTAVWGLETVSFGGYSVIHLA